MKWRLARLVVALHAGLYRLTKGRFGGRWGKAPVLLLSTTGRRSGKRRIAPLLYTRDGENLAVIASKGGDPRHPAWYLNLHAGGAQVQVGGERWHVRARDADGDERERIWAAMVSLWPTYAVYQEKTARLIPVVVLEPA